jgi:hypothetical protein
MALAIVAVLVPRWLIAPIVAGGAAWIAANAVRDEVRRLQMPPAVGPMKLWKLMRPDWDEHCGEGDA